MDFHDVSISDASGETAAGLPSDTATVPKNHAPIRPGRIVNRFEARWFGSARN
jgi:hypothetical protein